MEHTKTQSFYRGFFYAAGLLILALGLILNNKSGLGTSPITSISFSISIISGHAFGNVTLIIYILFVAIQLVLHTTGKEKASKSVLVKDVLQLPMGLIFTRFMNLFTDWIPDFSTAYPDSFFGSVPWRLIVLLCGMTCTGIGAAMSLNMRLIPNPGDGVVQAIADRIGKSIGFTKNCTDLFCVLTTLCICLIFSDRIVGIGLGTIVAMVGLGRIIAIFNHFTLQKTLALAGLA